MTKEDITSYVKDRLNINNTISFGENPLTAMVDISNSDSFGVMYSKLDNNKKLKELEDSTLVTENNTSVIFSDDEYKNLIITLKADYDGDTYQLVVTDNK